MSKIKRVLWEKRIPVILANGKFFFSKRSIRFFKGSLNSFNVGDVISREHASFSDIYSLYMRCPELVLKSGCIENVISFSVANSRQFNSKCFHSHHKDGSIADWSNSAAVKSKLKSVFACFYDGARHSLENKNYHFRDNDFTNKCIQFVEMMGYQLKDIPE
ncbi:DUF3223 domain-containing protein [Pseudocolwellia sp. HL-MZ7]|uniref:DUF3223 domain-containing protein n=1 Tax=Pseudocolwellia sp. HL-MZ7 TaxID=3400627 RepID=UPI003CFBB40B